MSKTENKYRKMTNEKLKEECQYLNDWYNILWEFTIQGELKEEFNKCCECVTAVDNEMVRRGIKNNNSNLK